MNQTGGSRAWKIIVGILAALLVIILLAEIGLRMYIANRVESEIAEAAPTPATAPARIEFSAAPLTFGLIRGQVPHVTLSLPSTLQVDDGGFSGQPAATVNIDRIRSTDDGYVADSLDVTTLLPDSFVQVVLQQELTKALDQLGGIVPQNLLDKVVNISGVESNPEDNSVTIQFSSGLAGIKLHPEMDGDTLAFTADKTSLLGIDLPNMVAEQITRVMHEGMQDAVFRSLRPKDFKVIEGGMLVSLDGQDINIRQLTAGL